MEVSTHTRRRLGLLDDIKWLTRNRNKKNNVSFIWNLAHKTPNLWKTDHENGAGRYGFCRLLVRLSQMFLKPLPIGVCFFWDVHVDNLHFTRRPLSIGENSQLAASLLLNVFTWKCMTFPWTKIQVHRFIPSCHPFIAAAVGVLSLFLEKVRMRTEDRINCTTL